VFYPKQNAATETLKTESKVSCEELPLQTMPTKVVPLGEGIVINGLGEGNKRSDWTMDMPKI